MSSKSSAKTSGDVPVEADEGLNAKTEMRKTIRKKKIFNIKKIQTKTKHQIEKTKTTKIINQK